VVRQRVQSGSQSCVTETADSLGITEAVLLEWVDSSSSNDTSGSCDSSGGYGSDSSGYDGGGSGGYDGGGSGGYDGGSCDGGSW
jgi:hypothetical protein